MSEPRTTYLEDEFRFVWDDLDIEIVIERFREERGELKASAQPQSASGKGFLPPDNITLGSARSIKMYANTLADRGMLAADEWFDVLSKAAALSIKRYREGAPSVVLSDVDLTDRKRFLVWPLIEYGVRTILFGDGGVSKSLHSTALSVAVATGVDVIPGTRVLVTGPVLYLDWEDEAETHAERLAAICAGLGIPVPDNIHYMRRTGSLHESTREIRREIARLGAVLVIVDSVGAACGGDPEKAVDIIKAFDAMRALGVTVLALHHVTKDQKDRTKPFGSVYSPNLARLTWRLDGERGKDEIYVRAQSFKGNNNGELAPLGHRVGFDADDDGRLVSVEFSAAADNRVPAAGAGNGLRNKIATAVKTTPMTVEEIAVEIGTTQPTIRTQLNRHKDWFVKLPDGRWGLRADEAHTSGSYQPNTGLVHTVPPPPPLGGVGTSDTFEERDDQIGMEW